MVARRLQAVLWSLVGVCLCAPSGGMAGTRAEKILGDRVELFAAMDAKQIELQLIPKNAERATVIIRNLTKRPLSIEMPPAFVGLPVLAQVGGGNVGGGVGGGGVGGGGGANQGFGGGMGGGMMGGGMMGGMFHVGPERVGKIKLQTICLEHGKEDPNPRIPYELKPIESFTDNAELIEVCKMVGRGELNQLTAQAAAWHLSDGLSWSELAQKIKVQHLNGQVELYFHPQHIRQAMQAVFVARQRAETDRATSPGEQLDRLEEADRSVP